MEVVSGDPGGANGACRCRGRRLNILYFVHAITVDLHAALIIGGGFMTGDTLRVG